MIKKLMNNRRTTKAVVIFAAIAAFLSCSGEPEPRSRVEFLLGTACAVTLYDGASTDLFNRVFDRVREIENLMSVNIRESDIARINAAAAGKPVRVARETYSIIESGIEFSRLSRGAFDISIGPLVSLWGIGTDNARIPGDEEISATRVKVDFRKIRLDPDGFQVILTDPGMALDLGAIAKGYAADEAAGILRKAGVRRALLDFGGNVIVIGDHPKGRNWRIGVQNPELSRGTYLGVLEVTDRAVVSSGIYERFFFGDDGRRYHHILDTRKGFPVWNGVTGVTVAAKDSITADALSTALFALGVAEGLELAESVAGAEAIFVTEDRKMYATRGLKEFFSITDGSYSLEN